MAKSLNKIHLLNQMKTTGVLPVFHHTRTEVLFQVMRTIHRGGMSVLEFKHMRDNRSFKAFAQLIEIATDFPGFAVGAGTVIDAASAHQFIKAGAQFISSPFLHKEVGSICEDYNVTWIPGCSSREEVEEAIRLKADIINIVQANIPVLDFLRQCTRDFPDVYFVPSSGVEVVKNNISHLFDAGALCLRLGDSLFRRNDILTRDWSNMEINFYQTIRGVMQVKKSKSAPYHYSIPA